MMRIGIVGLGLMGGSIAKGLIDTYPVYAYDRQVEAIDYAKNRGFITDGTTDIHSFFSGLNIVYLCLYPKQIIQFIHQYQHLIESNTILIDIAGIKDSLQKSINPILRSDLEFVYTHPIAGRELVGVEHSKASIFQGANYIITPHQKNSKEALDLAKKLASHLGFRTITFDQANIHDEQIAYTSQLTHLLSVALVHSEPTNDELRRYIGDSYRDLTRIAMINESLWSELFLANKEALLEKLSHFQHSLSLIQKAIEENNQEALEKLMQESKTKRLRLEREEL